jgi:hypothetical protein
VPTVKPVPSLGGRTLHPNLGPAGVQNQATLEERDDVLVYTSARLTTRLALARAGVGALGRFWTPTPRPERRTEICNSEVCCSAVVSEGRHTDTLSSADRCLSLRSLSDRILTTL